MLLTIQLKSNAVQINGVAIEDSTAAQVIRNSRRFDCLPDGIIVQLYSWDLPFKVLERIWPILNRIR